MPKKSSILTHVEKIEEYATHELQLEVVSGPTGPGGETR
jgi:hypothetical protein